jgi:hypothetical protein
MAKMALTMAWKGSGLAKGEVLLQRGSDLQNIEQDRIRTTALDVASENASSAPELDKSHTQSQTGAHSRRSLEIQG